MRNGENTNVFYSAGAAAKWNRCQVEHLVGEMCHHRFTRLPTDTKVHGDKLLDRMGIATSSCQLSPIAFTTMYEAIQNNDWILPPRNLWICEVVV